MQKGKSSSAVVLAVCTAVVCAAVLYSLRYSYLSCSDSVCEFVYGRIYDFGFAYKRTMDFCLQRGRFGLIFPFVVALRYKLLGTGNTFVLWSVQYVPICINVAVLSVILGKKAGAKCGMLMPLLFFSLLQVNGWHSLITCYPLDFMYGLTLSILGLVTFEKALFMEHGKKKVFTKILSAFLFYESMQTYEAFITVAAVYLVLCISHIRKQKKISIKAVFLSLDAHIVTGIIFAAMRVFVMVHPIVPLQEGVEDLSQLGNPKDFVITLGAFSGGMFPMADLVHPRVRSGILASGFGVKEVIISAIAGIGIFAFMKSVKADREAAAEVRTLGICGIVGALCFPMIHALTAVYQRWVTEGHQFGYVPTTISYFGWILSLTCIIAYLPLTGRVRGKVSPYAAGLLLCAASLITFGINDALKAEKIGPTTVSYAYKTQQFYALACDGYCREHGYDYLLASDYEGVHDNMMFHQIMMENESGTDYCPKLTLSADEFLAGASVAANPGVIIYDEDSNVAVVTDCDLMSDGHILTNDDIRIVSAHGGDFTVSYEEEGGRVSCDISLSAGEGATLENAVSVDTSTIDVVVR